MHAEIRFSYSFPSNKGADELQAFDGGEPNELQPWGTQACDGGEPDLVTVANPAQPMVVRL